MPAEPKPYSYLDDEHRPYVTIGTDEKELRDLAEAIVRGASISHAQIADLGALIKAVQSRPPKEPVAISEASKVKPTALVIHGGRVDTCDCSKLDIRVTLTASPRFGDEARFVGATFGDESSFARATFGDRANFADATFGDRANFADATFGERATFARATFGEMARFYRATFGERANFVGATFGERALFDRAIFGDDAGFDRATFGERARSVLAIFGDYASFGLTTFGDEASFDGATFGKRASFVDATIGDRACFDWATFGEGARFGRATFGERASFGAATFGEHANFFDATFGDRANFIDCNLNRASIKDAVFDRADLRRTRGILFDETRIAQVQMEGNAPDPWSKLRRQYTGPWFFVHLILLVIFFAPYVANIVALTAASKLQENMLEYTVVAEQRLETYQQEHPIAGRVAIDGTDAQKRISDIRSAYLKDRKKLPAVWILIGGNKGWWVVAMAIVIMFYNAMRAVLTLRISALRDAEERSNVTPRLDEYYGICHPLNDEDGNTFVAGIRTWLKGMWSKRLFAVPNWLRRRLPDDLQKRFSAEQPPSLIACVGLYRVHQLARLIMWIAILATVWNSLQWARDTWLWV